MSLHAADQRLNHRSPAAVMALVGRKNSVQTSADDYILFRNVKLVHSGPIEINVITGIVGNILLTHRE